jgi:uncharacterized protein YukE
VITSNTRLTPAEVNNIAQQHDNVADAIVRQQGLLDQNVNNLVAQNSGALITTLNNVHQNWDSTVTDIVTQLRNMAQDMRTAATQLQSEDTANSQVVAKAGAFHGFLG